MRHKAYAITLRGRKIYDGPKKPMNHEEEEEDIVVENSGKDKKREKGRYNQ